VRITFEENLPLEAPGAIQPAVQAAMHPAVEVPASEEPEPTPVLCISSGPQKDERFPITTVPFTIGRKQENHIVLQDERISGQHARVEREGDAWWLVDCGSGNGTYVNKRRIQRHRLRGGDPIVLGQTQLIFEGVPSEASRAGAPTGRMSFLQRVDEGGISEEDLSHLDVGRAMAEPASPLQALWTGVFLVSFVIILFFGYRMISEHYMARHGAVDPENLIDTNPSFEVVTGAGTIPGWSVDPDGDPAQVTSVAHPEVPHGQRALELAARGGGKRGFVRLVSDKNYELQGGGFHLSGQVFNQGFTLAGLEILWLVRSAKGLEAVGESFTSLVARRSGYASLGGKLYPPPSSGAELARVAVIGVGYDARKNGALEVDALSLKAIEGHAPEAVELLLPAPDSKDRDLKFAFCPDGSFSLTRGRERTIRNLRLAVTHGDEVPFGQLLAISFEGPSQEDSGAVASSFAVLTPSGRKLVLEQRSQRVGNAVKISWQLVGGEMRADEQFTLIAEMDPRRRELPVSLYLNRQKILSEGSLADLNGILADEWVVGSRSQHVIVSFSTPLHCALLKPESSRGVPTLSLKAANGLPGGFLDLFITTVSSREQERIDALFEEIAAAQKRDRQGEALVILDTLEGEFFWRDDVKSRVMQLRNTILHSGNERMAELRKIRADLAKYPDSPVLSLLRKRSGQLSEAYTGTDFAEQAAQMAREVEARKSEASEQRGAKRSERLLSRGKQHLNAKRYQLARFYLELVIKKYPSGPQVQEAAKLLQVIQIRD
ncbi:MAG: FHA domain-containing protein, partial [Planctomycetota bacterium]